MRLSSLSRPLGSLDSNRGSRPRSGAYARSLLTLAALLLAGLVSAPSTAPAAPLPDDRVITEIYDVRDLLHRRPDFPAPRLGLGGVTTADTDAIGENAAWTMESLVELIREAIAADAQNADIEISDARIHAIGSQLVISLPARSQERVAAVFRGLRTSGRAAFTIEARLLDVDDATIAALELPPLRSSRRTKSRRLTAEQGEQLLSFLEGRPGIELVCAPRLSLFANQRSHYVEIEQSVYVDRFEVGPTGETTEPVVEVLNTGLTFETRVIPRRGKPGVLLDWDIKVAQVVMSEEGAEVSPSVDEPELRVPEVLTIAREGRNVLGEGEFLLLRGVPHPRGDREGRQTLLLLRCDPIGANVTEDGTTPNEE